MHDKRTQVNIRRSRCRRGAGIEMAMLLMVVAVALSALLTSATMMQIDKQKDSEEQLEQLKQYMVLDQIGRDFCLQRASYVPSEGEVITYEYGTDEGCPGCCGDCTECDAIYTEPAENADDPETGENPNGGGGTGETDGAESRLECCNDCAECTKGCTKYTKISLVVSSSEKVVLTVELANNGDGTYTVTEWSYGE